VGSERSGGKGRRKGTAGSPASGLLDGDPNMAAAGQLHDMAAVQRNPHAQLGYTRAAAAVAALPVPVSQLVAEGTIADVPFIGKSSAAILVELVEQGASSRVEAALTASADPRRIADLRALRSRFLSEHLMQRVLATPASRPIVSRAALRGDFQMHSTWSDGAEPLEVLAEACLARGHSCMGITDHSHGLPVARGMSMERAARQQEEIDRLNERLAGRFRIFKGIEANILADGGLDLAPDERRRFEYVVASPHSLLRRGTDQTSRMVAAVAHPGVAILGHPRGRMYNRRAGVLADWPRVFAEAARRGVAIEIDGNWHRQDVDYALAAEALDAGCLFALDSDAHAVPELRFTDYAIAHARLARIPAGRVINCWSDARLDEWMRRRQYG
jgi:putative hydrolase